MLALAAAAIGTALAAASLLLARRVGALREELAELAGAVEELSARVAGAEQDAAGALTRTEAAEAVLVGKGLADEEDLEAARRRFDEPPPDAGRDELH